jgi:hypothetical protein
VGAERYSYDAMLVRYETAEHGCTFELFDSVPTAAARRASS